jgi:hypothetical protein
MFTIHVQKNIFLFSNEVGEALSGTRQGPILEYLWKNRLRFSIFFKKKMKNCSLSSKFCKNQEFFQKKLCHVCAASKFYIRL